MTSTQGKIIEQMMLNCIDNLSMTDKHAIMDLTHTELEVPKPTIRRVKKHMIKRYQNYIDILSGKSKTP